LKHEKSHFATLAVDAVLRLRGKPNLDYIQVIKKAGASLKDSFLEEGFILEKTYWMPAINGFEIPPKLSNPNGKSALGSEATFRQNPGVLGCYLSHLLILRDHRQKCRECDLLVFEDDVDFHPNLQELWTHFTANLPKEVHTSIDGPIAPVARLHIGGDAFWSAPIAKTESYYQVSWVSRTWGYVVKANAMERMLHFLQDNNAHVNPGIDQQLKDMVSSDDRDSKTIATSFRTLYESQTPAKQREMKAQIKAFYVDLETVEAQFHEEHKAHGALRQRGNSNGLALSTSNQSLGTKNAFAFQAK